MELADALPDGLTFVSAEGDGWTCDVTDTCTLDDPLAPSADAEPLSVVVEVTADAYPGVTNTRRSARAPRTPTTGTTSATDDVVVPPKVDLSVVKELVGELDGRHRGHLHADGPQRPASPRTRVS